jgi:hypothetical protein
MRKGDVVRRPFLGGSRPELIAVSPQPGVAVAIGTAATALERPTVTLGHPGDDLAGERLQMYRPIGTRLGNTDLCKGDGAG